MKKTKILLVLAIAMLAMFAMSACNIITAKIDRVEFQVMPKNYFEQEALKTNGITVSFTAYVGETPYAETVVVTSNDPQTINVAGFDIDVTVSGYSTELGSQELIVATTGAIVTYEYRVCKEIKTADALTTAATNGGYYILGDDVEVDARISFTKDNMTFVLYGEGNSVTAKGDNRVFDIQDLTDDTLVGGFYEFNNVIINKAYGEDGCVPRGINASNAEGITVNINACKVSGTYAIMFYGCNNINVNISNGSTADGWAALYILSNNSVFNVDNVELSGTNYYSGESNNFGTIVIEGAGYKATENVVGERGYNNVVNISNCKIANTTETECKQWLVCCSYAAAKNVINVVNCTDVNGDALSGETKGLFMMDDNDEGDQAGYWFAYKLTEAQRNKIYLDGTLYTVDDIK